jgi:hypothetical protein
LSGKRSAGVAKRCDKSVDQVLAAQDDKSHATLLFRINGIAEGVRRNLMLMETDTLEVFCCLAHRTLYFSRRYVSEATDSESGYI